MADAPPPSSSGQEPPRGIDSSVAHSARIWNYWLGGKDNYTIDREIGDQFSAIFPDIADIARSSRGFLARAVRYLAGEAGIRQFLDIGTGLPSVDNTHEVAQRVAPESHIVYVDNDPLVLAHARALLVSTPEGATEYIDSDLRDPDRILQAARATLDFSRPVALMLMNILGHVTEIDEARAIVKRLLDALPSGSYLVVADGTNVIKGPEFEEAIAIWNREGSTPYILRAPEEIALFFDGLELIEPGVVSCPRWRPHPVVLGSDREVDEFCGVARKP
ncbi:SAM-dependent methyltransferase [Streptosporangium sp. NPDC051023]|uniref:SAM-dependent methyltransferase n=1 Tax=Streptosporangium sp. NPDC051023 TaxID=3155410 RepID=UPI00344EFA6B